MPFQPSLAARAADTDTAIQSALRGEYDPWVDEALRGGLEACEQILRGLGFQPGVVNYFSYPDTHEALAFLRRYVDGADEDRILRDAIAEAKASLAQLLADKRLAGQVSEKLATRLRDHSRLFSQLAANLATRQLALDRALR